MKPISRPKNVTGKAKSNQVRTSNPMNNPNTVSNYHKTQTGAVYSPTKQATKKAKRNIGR